jgi:ribosomal protein S18 acetylase RimI-like enzyme
MSAFTFRALRCDDLPMLHEWLLRPHVRRWWLAPSTIAELRRDYLLDTESTTRAFIAIRDDRPVGFIQSYIVMGSGNGWWENETDPGARGIDQFLADEGDLGRHTGRAMITAFVDELFVDPQVTSVQTDPSPDNERAIRCYRAAGFETIGLVETPDGPALLMRVGRSSGQQRQGHLQRPSRDDRVRKASLQPNIAMPIDPTAIVIRVDDVRSAAVIELLQLHLRSVALHSPHESIHALDLDALRKPDITFWTAWQQERLLGCGALRALDGAHGEIKSMKTAPQHVRQGVAAALLGHIIDEARRRRYRRLSLETGSMEAFAPARALYARYGFEQCGPFADYVEDPYSIFMTMDLTRRADRR